MSLAAISISSMVGFRIVNISNIIYVYKKVQIHPFPKNFKHIS